MIPLQVVIKIFKGYLSIMALHFSAASWMAVIPLQIIIKISRRYPSNMDLLSKAPWMAVTCNAIVETYPFNPSLSTVKRNNMKRVINKKICLIKEHIYIYIYIYKGNSRGITMVTHQSKGFHSSHIYITPNNHPFITSESKAI